MEYFYTRSAIWEMYTLILDNKYIFDGNFGLERETLRVTSDGALAKTPHPFETNEYIDRDFCENQLELITPVCKSVDELFEKLTSLDAFVKQELRKKGEYLWLNSNPPHFETENDITIARFSGTNAFKRDYRVNLERRYGKRLMLYSGVHFNFSFTEDFLSSVGECKNKIYFRIHKYLCRYSWLLVLLSAASPVYDLSLDGDYLAGDGFDGYASRRSSEKGYWNRFVPVLDYSSLEAYAKSIKEYVKKGRLLSAAELYLPVRMKPPVGDNSFDTLISNGIDHIELRMFDVNPLSPVGIMKSDLEFAHYFIVYLMSLPDFEFTPELQTSAIINHKSAAQFNPDLINGYPAEEAALGLLEDMKLFFANTRAEANINFQITKIKENKRWCVEVYNRFRSGFDEKMLEMIKKEVTL